MSKVIMVQGTMSNAGKSLLCAGLCRIFAQDGYKTAPFKSQNMALNSYITDEGLEMGRAQVMQAEAAKIKPSVCMNPILLKPTTDMGSQVIVNGEVIGNMSAKEYFQYKKQLIPQIKQAFQKLEKTADIIVIEGAGSPAEINLKENDIVNMGMAELVNAPVLLVGDIDRGGVFAQLLGTLMLLEEKERERVKGLVINKFRGDKTILDSGISMLEEMGKVSVAGVVPYMQLALEDEDSLTMRFEKKKKEKIDFAVIRYPRISNFTDAGSLVNKELLTYTKKDCEIFNSAKMTLEEVIAVMEQAEAQKKTTVRLHTGDPSIYGAIREQMDLLEEKGIAYDSCPGVSACFGAAAALNLEYTIPAVSQSLIITRMEGKTKVPKKESIESFAAHQASMAIYLSTGLLEELEKKLVSGGYKKDTPSAIVYKATWPEEEVYLCTVATLAETAKKHHITKTALILVGNALAHQNYERSRLYAPDFETEFRKIKKEETK